MTRRERIWAKILGRVDMVADCWIWTGPTSGETGRGRGYPRMNLDGGTMAVHIVAFVLENGPIPPRKQVDHVCRNRLCVRPAHLEMVTHLRNQRRKAEARRGFVAEGVEA
jgi:hypothetical protein